MSFNNQKGIGLVEVMVALLLLAVAVLGFSALQMTAVKATDESLMRTRALTIMRSGAEVMRAHPQAINEFANVLNSSEAPTAADLDSCLSAISCTTAQLSRKDAAILKQFASNQNIRLALRECPGVASGQVRHCMIASWGETTADFGDGANCADANGAYRAGTSCFIMEAY